MKVINWDNTIEEETIATIGFFDGVHCGHRFLINQLIEESQKENLPTSIITFTNHPRKVIEPDFNFKLLNTLDEKLSYLEKLNIDYCYLIPFSKEVAEINAEDFIKNVLHDRLKVKCLIIGFDHRFGKNRESSFDDYVTYGKEVGMKVVLAERLGNESNKVSSTMIRKKLSEGEVRIATGLLGYNYSLSGTVIAGNQLGRSIGFPTANIQINDNSKAIPKDGVYSVVVKLDSDKYKGMLYIGNRPTISSQGEKRIEVHILDFDKDIYGKYISVEFIEFVRGNRTFNSLEELKRQLEIDRNSIIKLNFASK